MTAYRTEKDLSAHIRDMVKLRWGTDAVYRRIEDTANLGTFDSLLIVKGRMAWIELKVAGPNAKPGMRPGQPGFGRQWLVAGGLAWVLVGHPYGSLRLLWGDTTDEDWRDQLVGRYDDLTPELLEYMITPA